MIKFHRTLDQAFPFGPDYGCAIKCYRSERASGYLLAATVGIGLAVLLAAWWSS